MVKRVLIIFVIILAVLYLPIPIGKDICISIQPNRSTIIGSDGHPLPQNMAPSRYIITKEGFVFTANNDSFEKSEFIRYLNLIEKINVQINKSNEELIYNRILNWKYRRRLAKEH